MSADNKTQQKSLEPAGLENKSLNPADAEDKVAKPDVAKSASDDLVSIVVAHPVPAGRIGNQEDLAPGDTAKVSKYLAKQLAQQGVARLA